MQKNSQKLLEGEIDPAYAARASFIMRSVEKEKPATILDVGCGRGFYVNALSKYSFVKHIYGVDVNASYIAIGRRGENRKTTFTKASVYNLPHKNNSLDMIICSEVLEHLSDEKKGLNEIWRVLKPKGTLLVTVPHRNFPFFWDPLNWMLMKFINTHINKDRWFIAGIWADHIRLYTEDEIKKVINESGFNIERFSKAVSFSWPFTHFLLYGVGKNIIERFPSSELNRFNENKGIVSIILAKLFALPTKMKFGNGSAVNLLLKARKS